MSLVKLQILLKRKLDQAQLDRVEKLLEDVGVRVTARGAITLSATVSEDSFATLFGQSFTGQSGFSTGDAVDLSAPIPPGLSGDIASITTTPRHIPMSN